MIILHELHYSLVATLQLSNYLNVQNTLSYSWERQYFAPNSNFDAQYFQNLLLSKVMAR